MYGRRNQRKRSFKRVVVTLLTFVMLISVCMPGITVRAEDEPTVTVATYEELKGMNYEQLLAAYTEDAKAALTPEQVAEIDALLLSLTPADNTQDSVQEDDVNPAGKSTNIGNTTGEEGSDGVDTLAEEKNVIPEENGDGTNNNTVMDTEDENNSDEDITVGQQYLAQANALKTQAEALDPEAEDIEAQCTAIYDAAWQLVDEAQASWEADEMTYDEMQALVQVAEEIESILNAKQDSGDDNAANLPETYADLTIEAGGSGTYKPNNRNVQSVSDVTAPNGFTVTRSDNFIKIDVDSSVAAGTYTVSGTYTYRNSGGGGGGSSNTQSATFTITVEVTKLEGTIKVYVYVASQDSEGNSWVGNEEFLDLIGLNVCDNNKYFPAGVIELDASFLSGKDYNTTGIGFINSNEDWTSLLAALSNMDTTTLNGTYGVNADMSVGNNFSANRGNKVYQYLSQAEEYYNGIWGSQHTALFRWHDEPVANTGTASLGFDDQSVKYHLDLCFNTNKITFITGNNGISSGVAADGTTVDSRVYITGSIIQPPRNLTIPEGYQFMGYYEDAHFTIPWDGIGTPLNEDQTVYIKITEMANVVVQYIVAEGEGTVSLDNEAFNPVTGSPVGSTATAADGWMFDGWYAEEECTTLLSKDAEFVPTTPSGGWEAGKTYYYYAKFVPATGNLTITKIFAGLDDSTDKPSVEITVKDSSNNTVKTATLNSGNEWTVSWTDMTVGNYTVVETQPATTFGNYDYKSTTYSVNTATAVSGFEAAATVSGNATTTVAYTNTYERAYVDVVVEKQVTGNMGDVNKLFDFTASLTNAGTHVLAENEAKFSLSDNGTITISVPVGSTFTVNETDYSPAYTTSYKVYVGEEVKESGIVNNASVTVTRDGAKIVFTNDNTATIDTGVEMTSFPFILLLSTALVGAFVLIVCKRRYREF